MLNLVFAERSKGKTLQNTGSPASDCAKVKAYIAMKYWLKMLIKGIKPFSGCGHL